jgi:prepilin peptidase CpaA
MHVPSPDWTTLLALAVALAGVAICDVRDRRIPNFLVAVIAAAGVSHAALVSGAWGLAASLLGGLAGVALLYAQFTKGLMGAGDVKLLGAIGTWSGALGALYIMLGASVAGGVLAAGALVAVGRRERAAVVENLRRAAATLRLPLPEPGAMPRRRGIPFGVALAATGLAVVVWRVGR